MAIPLGEMARSEFCAIYNDLSHMNPLYLTPGRHRAFYIDEEILFHRKNIMLLSLYFDKIIICSDNISAFTKFSSKDVVFRVVTSRWFKELVDSQIVVLAGWGSSVNSDMMRNQIDYSAIYRPDLKNNSYNDFLHELSSRALWTIREASTGEADHIKYIIPLVGHLEGVFGAKDVGFIYDLLHQTNEHFGHIGTMEIFPFIDDLFGQDNAKCESFYNSYYMSWHEYCAKHYGPAIPIHTSRIWLPQTKVVLSNENNTVLSVLYSPVIFERYLIQQFGEKLFSKIIAADVQKLLAIRNGDWARFRTKYHDYLVSASKICWILLHPQAHRLLQSDDVIDKMLSDIIKSTKWDTDLSALGGVLDSVLRVAFGFAGVSPIVSLFRKAIYRRISHFLDRNVRRDLEPYLRKLKKLLETDMHPVSI